MACAQTLSGLARDCSPNIGGIVAAWVINHADVTAVTVTTGKISAITTTVIPGDTPSSVKFKKYNFRPATSNFESTLNGSEENGPQDVTTLINLVFGRMETTKRIEVEAFSWGELALIVKDGNGKFWYFGYDNPVFNPGGSTGSSGTARSDRNGYNVTLQDNSRTWPYEIDSQIITTSLVDEV